jgi:hypothetical protein
MTIVFFYSKTKSCKIIGSSGRLPGTAHGRSSQSGASLCITVLTSGKIRGFVRQFTWRARAKILRFFL